MKEKTTFTEADLEYLQVLTSSWKFQMKFLFNETYTDKNGKNKQKYNLKIPNFEGENHWCTMIKFLGSPKEQNGKYWENYHSYMKACRSVTNNKNEERDILNYVS